jgi:hypothetical protein
MATNGTLQEAFDCFHALKPWIYDKFCQTADLLIARGLTHASSTMILEAIKLEHALRAGEELKIANNHRAYYAKLWLEDHRPPAYPWRFFRMVAGSRPKR